MDQLKHHPFFYGVNWNSIRQIDAPFIPRLKSITDTSYFPTDELEQVPEEPAGADTTGTNKDLAFLGCVISRPPSSLLPLVCCPPDCWRGRNNRLTCLVFLLLDTLSSVSRYHRMRFN